jgi:hypothetical protein
MIVSRTLPQSMISFVASSGTRPPSNSALEAMGHSVRFSLRGCQWVWPAPQLGRSAAYVSVTRNLWR